MKTKKSVYSLFIMILVLILFNACHKETPSELPPVNNSPDTIPPIITLNGSNMKLTQFIDAYNEPGATATDNVDGLVNVVINGVVSTDTAGDYTIVYSASDASGNTAMAERTVIVSGSSYLEGSYTVNDYTGSTYNGSYTESISASIINNNFISFVRFGFYSNGSVYGTISGTTITIPQQTVICGIPPVSRTFAGTATYTNVPVSFILNYTETTNGTTVDSHGEYTKN